MSFLRRHSSAKEKKESKTASDGVSEFRKLFEGITTLSVKNFTLGPTLGTGTFGRVRLVTYTHNSKPSYFALKMLKKTEIIKLKQAEHIKAENGVQFAVQVFHKELASRSHRVVHWKLEVTTGNSKGSSLSGNSRVFVTLFGEKDVSREIELQPQIATFSSFVHSLNPFKKVKCVQFMIETHNLGSLQKISIRLHKPGSKHGWFLERVVVSQIQSGEKWIFPCMDWFDQTTNQRDLVLAN